MAIIEGFRVRNFRALKDVRIGKLLNLQDAEPLSALTVVIGKNGVGKSTLFDAFGFLSDCLKSGVEEACDSSGRGGFNKIRSQGTDGPIEFEVYYREDDESRPITYIVGIDADDQGRPYIASERLRQRRQGQAHGKPYSFLILNNGKGFVWKGQAEGIEESSEDDDKKIRETSEYEEVELDDNRKLGIATLGSLRQHPRIASFRAFIEGWYLSYFTPDAARSLPLAGPQRRLNKHGDNLGNVIQAFERDHKEEFKRILKKISERIPGIDRISTEKSPDGRLLIRFNDMGFKDPFYAQQMSDGTLKLFAYLLMLEDPTPPPFICIEEPENGLYHKLLETLASEFRKHVERSGIKSQIFVTTHQPYFVNALKPEEVWVLEKGPDGFSKIRRADEFKAVKELVAQSLPLGGLWYSDYLDGR